jgi:hypothetical protein
MILLQSGHFPAVKFAKLQVLSQQSKVPAEIRTKNAQIQVITMQFCIISLYYKFKIISSTNYTTQTSRRAYPDGQAVYGVGLLSLACWACISLL